MFLRRCFLVSLCVAVWMSGILTVQAEMAVASPSVILMEASTGQVIFEKNAAQRRSPASVTKVMTLLLTFEALKNGKVSLTDEVSTSEYASSMGGSQVFLAPGEVQTLETLIKCIVVASGNDASVAVAEHIAGSESAFVERMNDKAVELGMMDTHFVDCCGLTDSDDHYTCARDVAIMSRELIFHYPQVYEYTKIWMEDITHVTRQGTSNFTLSSTNKLLKQYQYTTGLKTGFTRKAMYCVSATAKKNDVELIAVVMGASDSKTRFQDARNLLNYGFATCRLYTDLHEEPQAPLSVKGGVENSVSLTVEEPFRYLDITGLDLSAMEKKSVLPESIPAPVCSGQKVGEMVYSLGGQEMGRVNILAAETVEKAGYGHYLKAVWIKFLLSP